MARRPHSMQLPAILPPRAALAVSGAALALLLAGTPDATAGTKPCRTGADGRPVPLGCKPAAAQAPVRPEEGGPVSALTFKDRQPARPKPETDADGRHVYRFQDGTTVTIGGSVQVEVLGRIR